MFSISKKVDSKIIRRIATILSAAIAVAIIASGTWSAQASTLGQAQEQVQTQAQGQQVGNPPSSPNATCPPDGQCFADVPSGNAFYTFVNRIFQQDLVTGYPCGGPGELCDPYNRPYYRPLNNVTRQQMAKFIDNARRLREIHIDVASGTIPIYANNTAGTAIGAYSTSGQALVAQSSSQSAIYAQSGNVTVISAFSTGGTDSVGVYGNAATGLKGAGETGVMGIGSEAGVFGESNNGAGYGIYGDNTVNGGIGVYGQSVGNGEGVYGSSPTGNGVRGHSSGPYGSGVYGDNDGGGNGVYGVSDGDGMFGTSTGNGAGVHGSSGVVGVLGNSTSGHGVEGNSYSGVGVFGSSGTQAGWAGYFQGSVEVTGNCCGAGAGTTRIDDPLDPANKYLNQSLVQSPDMISIYSGNVTTDAKGEATVAMPAYFEAVNGDFRYQLTVVGQFAQAIVRSKIKDNRFSIKTDKPNVEVSWQVTGIRHDPYAQQHPIIVEQAKPAAEQGKYLHPELYNEPSSKTIGGDPSAQPTIPVSK